MDNSQKYLNRKIKICHITSVEMTVRFILFDILKHLKSDGYDVTVVCSPGKWVESIGQYGINFKSIKLTRKMFTPLADLAAFFKMYFYFKKEKFDIVHTHTLKPEFYGQIAAKLAGVPIIVNTIHGFDFGDQTPFLKKTIVLFLERIAAKCSDTIFVVSNLIAKTFIQKKICEPDILRYWGGAVDVSKFDPKRFSPDFISNKKKELGINPGKKVICIVGRLVAEKGYFDLFKALKTILKKFPETILLAVGPEEPEKKDNFKPNITKKYKIDKKVIFLGERTDVDEIYSTIDMFVLPTHREGIGASILEASAMEKPVVATNTGGCPEAVSDKKTGILVPVKNVNELSAAIIYLFENPGKALEMGKNGREKILKEFDQEIVFERLEKEYKRLIQEKLRK